MSETVGCRNHAPGDRPVAAVPARVERVPAEGIERDEIARLHDRKIPYFKCNAVCGDPPFPVVHGAPHDVITGD